MDRNTIIGLVVIFGLVIGYSLYTAPSQEEIARQKQTQDSLHRVQLRNDSIALAQIKKDTTDKAQTDTSAPSVSSMRDKLGVFGIAAIGKDEDYTIENDLIKINISSKGGRISSVQLKKFTTYQDKPVILFKKDSSDFNLSFFVNNRTVNTRDLYFQPFWYNTQNQGKKNLSVSGNDSIMFGMRAYIDKGDSTFDPNRYFELRYTLYGNSYMNRMNIHFKGLENTVASNTDFIDLNWNAVLYQQEKSLKNERIISSVYYKPTNDKVDYLSETKASDENDLKTPLKWVSLKQQFFSATLIADNQFNNAKMKVFTDPDRGNEYLKTMNTTLGIPYNPSAEQSFSMQMYFGPNKYKILRSYKLDLERQIPLGWSFPLLQWINRYAVIPVFDLLESFNWNYGIIILVLTILLKIVLFPIAFKSYMSSAKMKVLKPEIDEIGKKFPKKEQAMDKQRATMALYKKAGVNPMAGCIPMLLQLPILIAMFRFFPASIELRHQAFLWAEDLSSYDAIVSWSTNIPLLTSFYGNHVSLFALLMAISNLIYTKMNSDMMGSTNQMPGMKTMMYIMPLMFLGFLNSYSSALNYYYTISTLFTFAQMFVIRKMVNEAKIHAMILENKKKPVKKSKFQQRLEDMAKARGMNTNNKR